jgi:hypothetical protein
MGQIFIYTLGFFFIAHATFIALKNSIPCYFKDVYLRSSTFGGMPIKRVDPKLAWPLLDFWCHAY